MRRLFPCEQLLDLPVIYSLVETCRKLGINPSDYLRETLDTLPTMQQKAAVDWTPARWKSIRESTDA